MKNLDYLRTLNAKKMAKFLTAFGEDCKYTGRDDEAAWEQWLNAERSPALKGGLDEILSD